MRLQEAYGACSRSRWFVGNRGLDQQRVGARLGGTAEALGFAVLGRSVPDIAVVPALVAKVRRRHQSGAKQHREKHA